MKTLIVGSGNELSSELLNKHYSWAEFVIAADGGYINLNNAGLIPNVLLGDFDSLPLELFENASSNKDIEIVKFPSHKDFTDLELAIELAIKKNTTELVILGATGNRLDHTTANFHLLFKLLKHSIKAYIEDDHNCIYLIGSSLDTTNETKLMNTLTIRSRQEYKVSIIPLPPYAKGVSTTGLSYQLHDVDFEFGTGLGISNEFSQEEATITVKEGLLLIFMSRD